MPGRFDACLSLCLSAPLPSCRNAYSGRPRLRAPRGASGHRQSPGAACGVPESPQNAPEASQGASERLVARAIVSLPAISPLWALWPPWSAPWGQWRGDGFQLSPITGCATRKSFLRSLITHRATPIS